MYNDNRFQGKQFTIKKYKHINYLLQLGNRLFNFFRTVVRLKKMRNIFKILIYIILEENIFMVVKTV